MPSMDYGIFNALAIGCFAPMCLVLLMPYSIKCVKHYLLLNMQLQLSVRHSSQHLSNVLF